MSEEQGDIGRLLAGIGADQENTEALLSALYNELRTTASCLMGSERGSHTLQPTALVHEAFLRLIDSEKVSEMGRLQFLATGAVAMRRILIDHARSRESQKRGGAWKRVTLGGLGVHEGEEQVELELDLVQLNAALETLEALDPRQAKIVELRFFSGMSGQEIGEHLGISRNTVVRELALSRAWLHRELSRGTPD